MICSNCGAYIGDEDAFCGECGQPVPAKAAAGPALTPEDVRDQETELLPAPLAPAEAAPAARVAKVRVARWPLIAAAAAVAVSLCLCAALFALYLIGRSAATPTPAAELPAVVPLYEDNFDAESGWDVYEDEDTWAEYVAGGYRLGVKSADYVTWGNPEDLPQFSDFRIEVDAWQVEGPLDNNLGLLVRCQDNDSFYWFQISSDGYYSVDLLQAGEWVSLVAWEPSPAIEQGAGVANHLVVECDGSQFDFSVNGTHLTTVTDASFASGSIGLAAGAFAEPGVVVQFDNLRVTALEE
jgi:hypothetical protein